MTPITVVIPTKNRGAETAVAAEAVLRDPSDFELVVVDQSTNDATEQALRATVHDSRLRVIRSPLHGISNARNAGVTAALAPIIAFTDDDCRPEPGWVSSLLRIFDNEPDVALVFGRVHLPSHSPVDSFAASFEPGRRVLQGAIPSPDGGFGIGANLAVRRLVLERLGGFDPLLGVGAPFFGAGEELDLMLRALQSGYRIVNATECDVLHLGLRSGTHMRSLAVRYQIGTGAALGKHARLAGLSGFRDFWRWTMFYAREAIRNTVRMRRPKLGAPLYILAGAFLSLRYRIDRVHGVFRWRGLRGTGLTNGQLTR